MKNKALLFLETTIQGNRIFGGKSLAEKIKRNLNGKRVCTSIFVLNEFKKTFLNAVICYYNLLVDSPDTQTALRRAVRYPERAHKRIAQVYATLCDKGGHDKEVVLECLESWIDDGLMIEFHESIEEPIVNKTSCRWVDGEPVKKGNIYYLKISCTKSDPPPCNIENFWKEHKKELHRLAAATSFKDSELSKVRDVAALIKKDKDSPYGENCHVHLSDAVIAIESPKRSQIYTTNKKHFEPICEVLKTKSVYKEIE